LPPYQVPAATVSAIDRVNLPLGGKESGGQILVTGPEISTDQRWVIEHATTSCTSSTPTTLFLYAGTVMPQNLLDGSAAGNFDVADWSPGLLVPGGSRLVAVWSGASTGAVGFLNLQLTVYSTGRG
jgi:hypothetical protein